MLGLLPKRDIEIAEDKHSNKENSSQDVNSSITQFDSSLLKSYINDFGYLRPLDPSEIVELKSVLLSATEDNYEALFCLGQLYIQEERSVSNLRLAYNAIKKASEHGIYEAGAFMAYFYLYGKVVTQDLDEAERRIKIDDNFKKNPFFVQMLVELYHIKGNSVIADIWQSKLNKLK